MTIQKLRDFEAIEVRKYGTQDRRRNARIARSKAARAERAARRAS